jgi:hypothetical protein
MRDLHDHSDEDLTYELESRGYEIYEDNSSNFGCFL